MSTPQDRLDMPLEDIIKQSKSEERGSDESGDVEMNQGGGGGQRSRGQGHQGRGGRSNRRHQPYSRQDGGDAGAPEYKRTRPKAPVIGLKELKVSSQSNPKTVAGALAASSRHGPVPDLLATGMQSLNQAVKAIAIARTYLEDDGFDLFCHPQMRDPNKSGVTFTFKKCRRPAGRTGNDMKVAGSSDIVKVAGAIAGQVRENERVSLLGIGGRSACQAILSICLAKKMLKDDNILISFKPEFTKITNTRDDMGSSSVVSGLRFHIHPERIDGDGPSDSSKE